MQFLRTFLFAIAFASFAVACGGGNKTTTEPMTEPAGTEEPAVDDTGSDDVAPGDDDMGGDEE